MMNPFPLMIKFLKTMYQKDLKHLEEEEDLKKHNKGR